MQTITTKCDICEEKGDHYPSWFSIERPPVGGKSVGKGLIQQAYGKPNVNYTGWMRYQKWVDLCETHRDKIIKAIQKISDKDKSE